MVKSTGSAGSKKTKQTEALMDWEVESFLKNTCATAKMKKFDGTLYFIGEPDSFVTVSKDLKDKVDHFQGKSLDAKKSIQKVFTDEGVVWILIPKDPDKSIAERNRGRLAPSEFSQARDLMGALMGSIEKSEVKSLKVIFKSASKQQKLGLLVGAEVGAYTFKQAIENKMPDLKIQWDGVDKNLLEEGAHIGTGTNLARHLVNLPANTLYPESYAKAVRSLFSGMAGVKVTIWDDLKLAKENMNLIMAVGQGSINKPRLVHIRYRPKGSGKHKPVALVGKGLTFDSGGLDIKPPANMRNMKKDMGGSAAVVGLFYSLVHQGYNKPLDIYLPMAENSISSCAFRPGDIYTSRNGKTVEIHNTDAEGRLVLADALAVASEETGDNKPKAIINVATLTGAVKFGLGVGMGGFFCNQDSLGDKIEKASQESGDLMWEMPLYDEYKTQLKTNVADINHCSTTAFGGAVTAALFLLEFVGQVDFAHFDIYSWADRAKGAIRECGGSGQAVQCLYQLMNKF